MISSFSNNLDIYLHAKDYENVLSQLLRASSFTCYQILLVALLYRVILLPQW
jgi:hypothetical protein